jgi:enterochelin esterase-like enzyme
MGLSRSAGWTRRRFIVAGLAGSAAVVGAGLELIDHGDLPGKHELDELDGACSVAVPKETFAANGPTVGGRFFSHARGREVGYAIAYPPGHGPGDRLPLALYLHADGGDHASPLGRLSAAMALAGNGIAPIALVACDGGRDLYWNPHPGDDPMRMLVDELIPLCRQLGLGTKRGSTGAIGISMGGYGAILLAEQHPTRVAAVAAISPAIWTSYAQAERVNPAAFATAQDFARDDVIAHADALTRTPVRIASGADDPFHDGVLKLTQKLGGNATVDLVGGCHDTTFFASQQQRSLQFLAQHITTT